MRTRIALVAITSIALITITILTQAVSVQPARAASRTSNRAILSSRVRHRAHQTAHRRRTSHHDQLVSAVSPRPAPAAVPAFSMGIDLLAGKRVGTKEVVPVPAPAPVAAPAPTPPATPVDTVTPYERSAWERVAMCEEGGNWSAGGSRFSGGLGITRANWVEYGGLRFAPEGAMATPDQQIMVAERIQSSPPDQGGCHGW